MSDLKHEAEALGIEVDGRWSEETLMQKIIEAQEQQPEPAGEPRFENVPLHVLNQQAIRAAKNRRLLENQAADKARNAVLDSLANRRPSGKPFRKPLRAPVA